MKKILRSISLLLMMAALSAPVYARKNTYNLSGIETSGINGLDYRLQKPLGNDTFPAEERGFFKHTFLGVGAGISMKGDNFTRFEKPGAHMSGQLGSWFTPVHGIRVLGGGGYRSLKQGNHKAWFGFGQIDYMLNLSYLLRGYNPNRMFELIGTVGPSFQLEHHNGAWNNSYGIGASFQMRFNVNPAMYLYVEPRFSVMSSNHADDYERFYRFKTFTALNLGLGYRFRYGKYRREGASDFHQINDDNLYFGAAAGLWTMPRSAITMDDFFTQLYAGKQLSSFSGVQLNVGVGHRTRNVRNGYLGVASLDYVLNLDNAFGGYRPDQVFNMTLNVGVGAGMAHRNGKDTFSPSFGAGLTGLFRLSPNWAITLHPQMYLFNRSLTHQLAVGYSPVVSMGLGLRYTIGNFSVTHPESYTLFNSEETRKWFIIGGAGLGYRFQGNFGVGTNMFVGVGKQFTPVSSWRASVNGDVFPRYPFSFDITGNIDYLSSITTAMYGYNPDRVFDLKMLIGILGGLSNYEGPVRSTYGFKAGFQGAFRLNKHLDIFIEPQFVVSNVPHINLHRKWTQELRANIGLLYRLGTPAEGGGSLSDTPYGKHQNFAGISAGPSLYAGSISRKNLNMSGVFDLTVGRWFSRVSALRFMYSNDFVPHAYAKKTEYFGSAHIDYLFNLSSLMDRNVDRRFHIIGAVGGGLGYSPNGKSKTGYMAYGGVQFRYNLPFNIDVHFEPGATFWSGHLKPRNYSRGSRFVVGARATAGVSYRF